MIFKHEKTALTELGALKTFTSAEISDSGISIGFECLDREMFDPEKCYDLLGTTGIKWARCQTGWNRCEKQKGVYDFTWLDRIIDNLLARKIRPWFNVGYGNRIYMPDVSNEAAVGYVPLYYGEETLQAWKNYVRALALHFKDRIEYFEIWNESNISSFWQPNGRNPLEYAKLIKLTGDEIRAVIPEAKIGACTSGAAACQADGYVIKLFRSGILKDLDFFCVHSYCVQPELNYRKNLALLRRTLDSNGGQHVELWQGEGGFASWFPENHQLPPYLLESERNQAVWMLRRYFIDFSIGLKKSSFFQMADMKDNYQIAVCTKKNPARQGLLNKGSYTPKQSFYAMKNLTSFFRNGMTPADIYCGTSLEDALPRTERHSRLIDMAIVTNTFVRDGYPFFEYHLAEDMQYGFEGIAPFGLKTEIASDLKPIQNPVLLNMLNGRIYKIMNWKPDPHDAFLIFSDLPLTDYPLVVCDEAALQ